jgi:hypothetical protein
VTPGQASPYGTHTAPAGSIGGRGGGAISLQTLIVASVASAVSSFVVSKIWGPGTLFSAAATPIIVALVSELVRRPVGQVGATAQKVAPLRYRPPGGSDQTDPPRQYERFPPPPAPSVPAGTPVADGQYEQAGAQPVVEGPRARPRWRLVLSTGLLACLIVVGLFTTLDVLAGQSITGNGDGTTYFSGRTTHTAPPSTPTTPTIGATGTTGATTPGTPTTPSVVTPAPSVGVTGPTGGTTGATGATATANPTQPSATAP